MPSRRERGEGPNRRADRVVEPDLRHGCFVVYFEFGVQVGVGLLTREGLLTNGVAHKKSQYEAHTLRYLSMPYDNMNDKLKRGEGLISKP